MDPENVGYMLFARQHHTNIAIFEVSKIFAQVICVAGVFPIKFIASPASPVLRHRTNFVNDWRIPMLLVGATPC